MDFSNSALFITILNIFGIFISQFSNITATNSPPRWEMPCGTEVTPPSNPAFPPPPAEEPEDPVDTIASMLIRIHEGRSFSSNLRQNMTIKRIRSLQRAQFLDTLSLTGFPHVAANTEAEIENSLQNITKTKLNTYKDLSIVAVFFEQMKLDEQMYEDGYYEQKIVKVESKLYDILCHLYTALRNLDADINHVTRKSMEMHITTVPDRMNRYERDYMIVKDTTRLMDKLMVTYTEIKNHLSQVS